MNLRVHSSFALLVHKVRTATHRYKNRRYYAPIKKKQQLPAKYELNYKDPVSQGSVNSMRRAHTLLTSLCNKMAVHTINLITYAVYWPSYGTYAEHISYAAHVRPRAAERRVGIRGYRKAWRMDRLIVRYLNMPYQPQRLFSIQWIGGWHRFVNWKGLKRNCSWIQFKVH
jgi:hypothetical protein